MHRTIGLFAAALLVVLVGAAAAPSASAHHSPGIFDGTYKYHDVVDGSNLTLWIVGGNDKLALYDDEGSVCEGVGLGLVPAFHQGDMVQVGDYAWDVTGAVQCFHAGKWVTVIESLTLTYEGDEGGHWLVDNHGQPYKQIP